MDDSVAVIHHDLMAKGGGEAVAMNVLEALQDRYDVTLFTLTDPDFDELNRYFRTSVRDVDVEIAGQVPAWLHDRFGIKFYILQNALLGRYARMQADDYDLLFSTINELGLEDDAVQYVHFPFDWSVSLPNREHIFHPTVEDDGLYERLCTAVAGVDPTDIRSNRLLANSGWTADVVEDAYGARPEVVYPPVDTRAFDPQPWHAREDGFVTIGRIERSKRIKELIEIVDGLRERGHDTHLHVVGPTVDEEYRGEVETVAEERPHVHLEGEIDRERLVDLACSHKYGIHGKEYEHFGMAVAELVAAGCVTFVPENGGQHEIVGDRAELCFDSVADAVDRADGVLSRTGEPADLRWSLAEIRHNYGRERFKKEIATTVAEELDRPTPSPAAAEPGERPVVALEEAEDD